MKKLLIMAFAASVFAACCNNGGAACDARNLDRAKATLDSRIVFTAERVPEKGQR